MDVWDDHRIKTKLENVADRIQRHGLGAEIPDAEEQMALQLAVAQLFRIWYDEFYK